MLLAQHDQTVEQLSTQRAHEALNERRLPGALAGDAHFLDAAVIEECGDFMAVDAVIVPEHIARLLALEGRLTKLLDHPVRRERVDRSPMDDVSRGYRTESRREDVMFEAGLAAQATER